MLEGTNANYWTFNKGLFRKFPLLCDLKECVMNQLQLFQSFMKAISTITLSNLVCIRM
jgi:hypothetical protein